LRNKVSIEEYLAFLSLKYGVDPDRLFHALVSAENNQTARCGKLSIKCRGELQGKLVFLITNDQRVVAQFRIPRGFFRERHNPIRNLAKTNTMRRRLIEKNRKQQQLNIGDLRSGMKQVALKAKVIEITKPILVVTRFGNYANVANALLADETGKIKLSLWNEQINSLSVGDIIQIANAHVAMFRSERQLRIGKKGTLSVVENTNSVNFKIDSPKQIGK